MKEIWKDIIGYEGFYRISNWGRVKSLRRTVVKSDGKTQLVIGKVLKPTRDKKGYLHVCLSVGGVNVNRSVHRLVAMAFIPNPYNYTQINHRDENPSNNKLENLEWCSAEYNLNYGNRNKKASISRSTKVAQFSLDGIFIQTFFGTREAGRQIGHGASASANIAACCRGKRDKAYGFRWKYIYKTS